ncbi:phosphatase [Candidatus Uabimicrobium amorphum]|uniref:protein-tyrosine-phosphatase n=2 Tax=Uabimicrobium amorphum TaxID=2596890 RepID=A0A5S9IK02_UABAM|nr:phosphatase [Candidatus Uabimicrobium amorphum]
MAKTRFSLWKWKTMSKINICVVCSGNICRSPFVEYVLKKELDNNYHVFSAGLLGIYKQPAYEVCVALAPRFGVRLEPHKSQGVTGENVQQCDYILAMTQTHLKGLSIYLPKRRPYLLSEFLDKDAVYDLGGLGKVRCGDDIPDPMGQNSLVVEPVLKLLKEATMKFIERLKNDDLPE